MLARATVRCRLRLAAIIITSNRYRLFTVFINSIFSNLSIISIRHCPRNIVLSLQADDVQPGCRDTQCKNSFSYLAKINLEMQPHPH